VNVGPLIAQFGGRGIRIDDSDKIEILFLLLHVKVILRPEMGNLLISERIAGGDSAPATYAEIMTKRVWNKAVTRLPRDNDPGVHKSCLKVKKLNQQ